jgi:hypothetical protein
MKMTSMLLCAATLAAIPAVAQSPALRLDRPGALEALAAANPDHYRRAVEIIRVAQAMPCGKRLLMVAAKHDGKITQCAAALILTSYPAKRDLAFTLDDTPYMMRVTMIADAGVMPALR